VTWGIFRPEREKKMERQKVLHNSYSSPNIISTIKLREKRVGLAERIASDTKPEDIKRRNYWKDSGIYKR
jgi:hypothetical protein